MKELLERFNIKNTNALFEEIYENTLAEFDREGNFFLKKGFVEDIQEKYSPFSEYYDFILSERDRLASRPELSLFSLLLHRMLEKNRDAFGELIPMFERNPISSSEDETDFEFTGFFAELAFAPEMAEFYIGRGLPREYFSDTLHDMYETAGIYAYSLSVGRLGYNNTTYFEWNQYYIYHKIVKIGELNFETASFPDWCVGLRNVNGEYKLLACNKGVTKEGYILGTLGIEEEEFFADFAETEDAFVGYEIDTEDGLVTKNLVTLPKSEWTCAIKEGDGFLNVHIPRNGNITKENNEFAYREALRLHKRIFPEWEIKAVGCTTWLLSTELSELLPEGSKICEFADGYRKIPRKTSGKNVFNFLFPKKAEKYEDLEENTTLQRKVKSLYLSGGAIIDRAGLVFPDEL